MLPTCKQSYKQENLVELYESGPVKIETIVRGGKIFIAVLSRRVSGEYGVGVIGVGIVDPMVELTMEMVGQKCGLGTDWRGTMESGGAYCCVLDPLGPACLRERALCP